jgi:CMP-N-acetylneuraminic acid synthetase
MKKDEAIGVVHAKSSSSRIQQKNSLKFFDEPLYLIALKKLASIGISEVFLDTDSDEFIQIASLNGFLTSKRPKHEANNSVDGNKLILNFLNRENLSPNIVVQLSCTMPFISTLTLQSVFRESVKSDTSGFLGTMQKNYSWIKSESHLITPTYNVLHIPNSVDLRDQINEVSGFYVVKLDQQSSKILRIPRPSVMFITNEYETFDLNFSPDYEFSRIIELGLKEVGRTELPSGLTGQKFFFK